MNRTYHSVYGGSIEIKFTVPLTVKLCDTIMITELLDFQEYSAKFRFSRV